MTIFLRESEEPFRILNLIARAYNDGIAFRYQILERAQIQTPILQPDQIDISYLAEYDKLNDWLIETGALIPKPYPNWKNAPTYIIN
jgi:hypothetical protein